MREPEELQSIQEYLHELGLTAWVSRNSKLVEGTPKSAVTPATTTSASASATASATTSAAASSPAPAKPAAASSPAASKPATQTKLEVFRLGARAYANVVVVYSLTDKGDLSEAENKLLESMLGKCGLDLSNWHLTPEKILNFPPLMPDLAQLMSVEENAMQQVCAGFLASLTAEIAESEETQKFLLLLGKDLAKYFGDQNQAQAIVLDELGTMVSQPATRKVAWESLVPLRDALK